MGMGESIAITIGSAQRHPASAESAHPTHLSHFSHLAHPPLPQSTTQAFVANCIFLILKFSPADPADIRRNTAENTTLTSPTWSAATSRLSGIPHILSPLPAP